MPGISAQLRIGSLRLPPMQPNFIAILVDDLRYDEFGAGGHPYKLKNLARSASHAAIRASLRREMRRLVADAAGI